MSWVESITWHGVEEQLPDSDTTVLIRILNNSEPVWLGWYDDQEGSFFEVSGGEIDGVIEWAHIPKGRQ